MCRRRCVCVESLTASTDWVTEFEVCVSDGIDDVIELKNSAAVPVGFNYAFLLTDESGNLLEVLLDTVYNFENTNLEEQRVYGISYSGQLFPKYGEDRLNTTASGCSIHSGDDLFLRIRKSQECGITSTEELDEPGNITVYPNPSDGNFSIDTEDVELEKFDAKVYSINGQLVQDITGQSSFFLEDSGVYLIQFFGQDRVITTKVIVR